MSTNLLFLGELFTHEKNYLPFLNSHGYKVTVINTSYYDFPRKISGTDIEVENIYEQSSLARKFFSRTEGWFIKAGLYNLFGSTRLFKNKLQKIIKQNDINIIYGSWGSYSLPEMQMVQKLGIPVVYEFLTYPYYKRPFAELVENTFNNHIISKLAGRILATERMFHYFEKTFSVRDGRDIVFPELYSEQCFYRRKLPCLSDSDHEPHIVFLGLQEDEIFSQFKEILRRRIHVHVRETGSQAETLLKFRYADLFHTFRKFNETELFDGSFATFMTQFDAFLVTHNFDKAISMDRFYNSVPNRFSFGLTSGIPIIMPYGYLLGCQEIVSKNQAGFAYKTYDDLREKLFNVDLMKYYRNNSTNFSKISTLDYNFNKIDKFLKKCKSLS